MLTFKISDKDRKRLEPIHRRFQAGISALANKKVGAVAPDDRVDGIFKCEGGVCVNNREICIKEETVRDDWRRSGDTPFPEEVAVVEAMLELVERVKKGDDLAEFDQYVIHGNNLTSFFRV